LSRPFSPRSSYSPGSAVRVNGKIRAREVRVIGTDGQQLGVIPLADAINLARAKGVDLVEIAATANPPVCRLVDFGKYRYEQAKKEKEARKHQHANKVKEIQLSPGIDPHDFGVKLSHAIDFMCEEMKVKVTLRFRGREMAHKEFGFQQIEKFTKEVAPYGHPDSPAKLVGKGITVMFSPLPRNKRAKNPRQAEIDAERAAGGGVPEETHDEVEPEQHSSETAPVQVKAGGKAPQKQSPSASFNNPFSKLDLNAPQNPPADSQPES
jgi:translation initiation factor IF-3